MRLAARFCPPAVLLVLVIGFNWRILLTRTHTWLNEPALAYQVLPWFQFQAREFHQGRFPLWDPNQWGGLPVLGPALPGPAYPLHWLLFALPLRDGTIRLASLDLYFLTVHFLGALFAYWLCRDLRRSRLASLLAGVCFALGGSLGAAVWPGTLGALIWAPLVFLFLLRVARRRKPWSSAALSGLCIGAACLAGDQQVPVALALAAAGLWLYLIFRRRRPDWRVAGLAALAALFAGLTAAVQLLPVYEYSRLAMEHEERAASSMQFLGVTVLCLAFLGLALRRRRRCVRILAAVAVGGALYAMYDGAQGMVLFDVGAVVLMAFGLDALQVLKWLRGRPVLRVGAVTCAIGFALVELGFTSGPAVVPKAEAKNLNRLYADADVVKYLRAQPGLFRLQVDPQEIPYNFGDWHNFHDIGGRFESLPRLVRVMGEFADRRAAYGARYSITRRPPTAEQQLVFQSASGLKIYRNSDVAERAWTERPEPCEAPDSIRVTEYLPRRVALEASLPCPGMVILIDNNLPGWRVRVDGQPAVIEPAYWSLRGVQLLAGRRRIEMEYRPWTVFAGALLSLAGVLGAAALALRDRLQLSQS